MYIYMCVCVYVKECVCIEGGSAVASRAAGRGVFQTKILLASFNLSKANLKNEIRASALHSNATLAVLVNIISVGECQLALVVLYVSTLDV